MAEAHERASSEVDAPGPRPAARGRAAVALAAAGFLALLGVVFGDLLFAGGLDIPSHAQGDTARWYVYTRLFGFAELRGGHVPLWNPHTFSGMPFVGTFQSALFHPPSWLHLFTDLRLGLVLEFVVTLFVLAMTSFLWLRGKDIAAGPAFVAAGVVIFASTVSLRVLAGQLSVLQTFAWWPLLLAAVDALVRRPSLGWTLAGIAAVTLMILAGHPPTVLQAGIATGLYVVPLLMASDRRPVRGVRLLPLVLAPPLLAAVQLFEGLSTATESLRRSGMSYAFATSFSFPPEQLLTLLAPDLFGDADRFHLSYFGRVFYWDATFFVGVLAALLAVHGWLGGPRRAARTSLALTAVTVLIAMGGYTPLYRLLYAVVPGFDLVRAPSKLLFFASVFVAWAVALGVERLERDRGRARGTVAVAAAAAALAAALFVWASLSPVSLTEGGGPLVWLASLARAPEFVVVGDAADWHVRFVSGAAVAAATAGLGAVLLALAPRRRAAAVVLVVLAIVELLVFARLSRGTTRMTIDLDLRPEVAAAYAHAGRQRVHETAAPSNIALARRRYAIWGYDPVVLRRYIEFMMWSQGADWRDIRRPTVFVPLEPHPLHALLRVRYRFDWRTKQRLERRDAWPRFVFFDDYELRATDAVLDRMAEPDFDPRARVVLESAPDPPPTGAPPAVPSPPVRILGESTDHFDLEVTLDRPRILVITDAWSAGWRARALPGSDQARYDVLPADYVLRAIPLGAGQHRLRVEYAPRAFRVGLATTAVCGAGYAVALAVWAVRRRRARAGRGA